MTVEEATSQMTGAAATCLTGALAAYLRQTDDIDDFSVGMSEKLLSYQKPFFAASR